MRTPRLTIAAAALWLAALPATPAGAAPDPAADPAVSWQGPLPGSGPPPVEVARAARDACRQGKLAARRPGDPTGGGDQALREDDPLTWYDVTGYGLNIAVYQGASSLSGSVVMEATSLHEGLGEVVLHAGPNLTIGTVLYDGDQVPAAHEGDRLTVDLQNTLGEGADFSLEISYTAQFNGCGVLSTWRTNVQTGQSIHTITTQSEPFDARCWWPCKDDTRDKADATTISVTTDDFNTVVSNGVLQSDVDHGDGTRTVTWHEGWPMVTYLVSMCVTEYNHAQVQWTWEGGSMPLHDWSWGLSTGDQQAVLQAGLMALTALSDEYNHYPFWDEKYGHAQYTWGGAMEHQTCSSMGFYNESVIAHELAHQWFGDKITCDTFHHIWLNEGWATYSEAVYYEHYYGEETLHEYMNYEEYFGPGTIYIENPETDNIFDGNLSYAKGSWVVHMLRHVMGEEAFWTAVRAYLGPNEPDFHRTADTDEFRAFMEAEHGADLSWFFDQWIMGEYYPDYAYFHSTTPQGGNTLVEVGIIQQQAPARQTFRMPVDCRVHLADGGSQTVVLDNDAVAQSFSFTVPGQVTGLELDPDDWILGPATSLPGPPMTDIDITGVHLLDEAGAPLERLPAGGPFQVAFTLTNRGGESGGLAIDLSSSHPDMDLNQSFSRPGLGFGGVDEIQRPGSTLDGISGYVPITVTVTWEGGSSTGTWSFPAGHPEVLLVDDDGGDDYQSWFEAAMDGVLDYETATPDSLPAALDGYGLVVWMSGDARRALSESEWSRLGLYAGAAGGHLVLTGQNFVEAQDPGLLSSHTGVQLINPSHDDNAVMGTPNGIFTGRPFYLFNGGAGNQDEMDMIFGVLDCMAPQAHYNNAEEGSAAEELWCGEGGVMTFGFGLEGVADIGNGISLREVLQTLRAWSQGETGLEPAPSARPGAAFRLAGAWPNPFNPSTTLRWESRLAGTLRGEVFNLAGQRVASFTPREVGPGAGALVWRPEGRASGLYLARLELETADGGRHAATLKLMLLQ